MRRKRVLRTMIALVILAAVAGLAGFWLSTMLVSDEEESYVSYTVRRGDIATEKSFSATLSVLYSETHQNTTQASMIREIYVTAGQQVKEGDKLMLLDNGELLRAGLDGVVTSMRFDTTDWLWNNVQLIQVSNLTNLRASLSVDEYDVRAISAGQKCTVTIIPLGLSIDAEITHVDRVSASSGQVASYTATAEVVVPENVLPGMTASVSLPDRSAENVLLLDMAALSFDDEGNPFVLVQKGEVYEKTPVAVGLSDGMQVEIQSGLQEGDTVWAVEEVKAERESFSLAALYKKLVGERIVINDLTGGSSTQRQRQTGEGSATQRMENMPEGFPESVSEGSSSRFPSGRTEGAQGSAAGRDAGWPGASSGMAADGSNGPEGVRERENPATSTDLTEQRAPQRNQTPERNQNNNQNRNEEKEEQE